jgi:hypothetical protein
MSTPDDAPVVDPQQVSLFDRDEHSSWWQEWKNMPEFDQQDLTPLTSVIVHFATSADLKAFAELVDQRITLNTQSIWYPEAEIGRFADKRYADDDES